ncbi:tetratricopeptide repeat protein [Rhizobium sp. MC63]|uniref:Tetratricopeptide repeat protein n=1 Tax=Rhizobium mulingense TaxID=3031128 RepID=A0ACC6N6K8_9HYPH|nr:MULTISPECIES: tetratricopeptide repeat protein [unclassified Rhizobium]MDF0700410.1 tetratricopeptide repeat protein [Rhizobium sp. MC63]MEA3521105.1 tetratricopeptide repeat protein [Rhizobium sp. MJ31]
MATLLTVLASSAAILAVTPASASEMPRQLTTEARKSYQAEQKTLAGYRTSKDAVTLLAYGRLLARGKIASDHNPLRVSDIDAAIAVYRSLLTTDDAGIHAKVVAELADLLLRKGGTENESEAVALRMDAAGGTAQSEPPAEMPVQQPTADTEAALRDKMAKGSLDAAFELLIALNRENSSEADMLRSQMLLMANLSALDGDSAVVRLSGRYASSFDAQKHPEALKALFELASGGGSESAVGEIEKNRKALISILGKDEVRRFLWKLVNGGSSRAAELIALDLVDEKIYGFDETDSKWAVSMLEEAGSYRANYVIAKLYYQGIYVDKDPARATAAMDRMLAGAAEAGQDRVVVADRFARMNLSDSLIAKYALPIYMDVWKGGKSSIIGRLARIIVSAEKAGYYASTADMPIPPERLVAELSNAYEIGDLSAGFILGDIYREGRLVGEEPAKARSIYEGLKQQYPDSPEMQLKLREQVAKLARRDLEVTLNYARYYEEIRALAEQQDPWAMKEYGVLLVKGAPQFEADPEAGFAMLLNALSLGYFGAGPDAADLALATNNADKLKRIADVYANFDPRILTPESNIQLAKIDVALKQFSKALQLLDTPEVLEVPAGRFLFAQVSLADGRLVASEAHRQMRDIILSFNGDGATLLGFIQQLMQEDGLSPEFVEPVLERLAELADKRDVNAITAAFKLRQKWPSSEALNFLKVVDWCSFLAERGQGGPLTRVAINVNAKAVGEESFSHLIDKVEEVLPHLPSNGNLRMFLAKQYLVGKYRPKDYAKADALTKQAAELGNEEALNSIATNYYFGQDVAMDRERAEALYRDLAFVGSNRSSLALARSYSKGPSTRVYESRAFAYYIKAALNGSVTAMTELGRSYLAGAGAAQDEAKGVAWLEKAAALGNTDAMIQLYYYNFIKSPTNHNPEAEHWMNALVAAEVPDMVLRKAVLLYDRDKEANKQEIFALLDHAERLGSQFARRLKNSYIREARAGVAK